MLSVKVRPGVSFFQVINESGTADFQFASCASAQEDFLLFGGKLCIFIIL